MTDGIRLGSIGGIRIGIHWSVLFVAWLLAWGLATSVLPGEAPGMHPASYWLAGMAVAGLFFVSLLAHELAHALIARRSGVEVEAVTLWLLGGVAKLRGAARTPAAEFWIAAAGPIVSGSSAAGFWLAGVALDGAGAPSLAVAAMAWLARVNLVLAVFNLLPGAPLDGGRILQAIAWYVRGDRVKAGLLAASTGRLLGIALVSFGAVELVVGADLGALWSIVVGIFIVTAAAAERDTAVMREALAGVRVEDAMTREPVLVPGGVTVSTFLEGYAGSAHQVAFPVVGAGGAVVGLIDREAAQDIPAGDRTTTRVGAIATPMCDIIVARPDELLLAVLERFSDRAARLHALVYDGGRLAGVVSSATAAHVIELADLRRRRSERTRGDGADRPRPTADVIPPRSWPPTKSG